MNALELLGVHARSELWCNPVSDGTQLVALTPITATTGVKRYVVVNYIKYGLPTDEWYVVFTMGTRNPKQMGLSTPTNGWVLLSDAAKNDRFVMTVSDKLGRVYPSTQTYICVGHQNEFIIALKVDKRFTGFAKNECLFELRHSDYFRTVPVDDSTEGIEIIGYDVTTKEIATTAISSFNTLSSRKGEVVAYVNGKVVSTLRTTNTPVGCYVELFWDSSYISVRDHLLSDLKTFSSSLIGGKQKYIIHDPVSNSDFREVIYQDDLDLYVINKSTDGSYVGVRLDRDFTGSSGSVTSITHRDHGVPVDKINEFVRVNGYQGSDESKDVYIRVMRRGTRYNQVVGVNTARPMDLYRLHTASTGKFLDALTGTSGYSGTGWLANQLELHPYIRAMTDRVAVGDDTTVKSIYGYYGAVSTIAQPIIPVIDGKVTTPLVYQLGSTVYEYNSSGVLLNRNYYYGGGGYLPSSTQTALVEFVHGSSTTESTGTDLNDVTLYDEQEMVNYRIYRKTRVSGSRWEDVTDNTAYYIKQGTTLSFIFDEQPEVYTIREDIRFIHQTVQYRTDTGEITFSIDPSDTGIPYSSLDVWLNNCILVRGIDYILRWPMVTITNKEYLTPTLQKIDYRCYGLCDSQMVVNDSVEVGFINNGLLSLNDEFGNLEGRVFRRIAGGSLLDPTKLKLDEERFSEVVTTVANGKPYELKQGYIPLTGLTSSECIALKQVDDTKDALVSNYLTSKMPKNYPSALNTITNKYNIFSPFLSKIIADISRGAFNDIDITEGFSGAELIARLEDYDELLRMDPIKNNINTDYVCIHPHCWGSVVYVTVKQHQLITYINNHFLDGLVDLSKFLAIR